MQSTSTFRNLGLAPQAIIYRPSRAKTKTKGLLRNRHWLNRRALNHGRGTGSNRARIAALIALGLFRPLAPLARLAVGHLYHFTLDRVALFLAELLDQLSDFARLAAVRVAGIRAAAVLVFAK